MTEDFDKELVLDARELPVDLLESLIFKDPAWQVPFKGGERFHYHIGWSLFDVGEAVISVENSEWKGEPALHIVLETKTNGFADAIYKVRNRSEAWIRPDASGTLHYRNDKSEGGEARKVQYDFDWEKRTVCYWNRSTDDRREPIAVIPGTWDPLSITFFARTIPLMPGKLLQIPTTNGKEFFVSRIAVEESDRDFKVGETEAIVLKPDIKDVGGVFKRSDNASMKFWYSDDDRRLLLRMESEVKVGSFWAELVKAELADGTVIEAEEDPRDLPRRRRR